MALACTLFVACKKETYKLKVRNNTSVPLTSVTVVSSKSSQTYSSLQTSQESEYKGFEDNQYQHVLINSGGSTYDLIWEIFHLF